MGLTRPSSTAAATAGASRPRGIDVTPFSLIGFFVCELLD